MPVCKNCGARISKFDKDMCPVCGAKKPLEGVSSETIEITSEINVGNPQFKAYKETKRGTLCLLFCTLGIFGAGLFYAKYKKPGFYWMFLNLVFIASIGTALLLLTKLGPLWSYLIPLFVVYAINIFVGFVFLFRHDVKDGNGEFIR
ncbi:MAG: hypothetical protein K6F07_03670 [Bacilli bacterium]|nr:hypothetical protein [Bacilli bacterium]